MILASADSHALVVQVVAGIVVISLAAILGVGLKMVAGQRRTHEALWGFDEGSTHRRGLVEIIHGNGHGDLLSVCEDALDQAKINGEALAEHVVVDDDRWAQIIPFLVPPEPPKSPGKVVPIKKSAPRKRAAPKKVSAS